MRHDDEFNSASYVPSKGDSFEFGSVFAHNEAGVRKDNASHASDLNSTDTNNDSVRSQRSKKVGHKEADRLDSRDLPKTSSSAAPNGANVTATSASAAGSASAASVAVQVAAIATATTIVIAGAAGLRTLIHPDASFSEIFATAHTIRYQADIDKAEEGDFSIHLFNGAYEDFQSASSGESNVGVFEGLELGQTYTLEIIQSAEGAETSILTSTRVTTENYNEFRGFNFDGVADFSDDSFVISLDYVDEGDVYSDFTLHLEDAYEGRRTRTYKLDKTTEEQKFYFNEPNSYSSDSYINARNMPFNYSMTYVSKEDGEEKTITYKEGKMLFMEKYCPKFVSFEYSDTVSQDGRWPLCLKVDDPKGYMDYAAVYFYKDKNSDPVVVGIDDFKNGWVDLGMSDAEAEFDFYNGESIIRVVGYTNRDMFYLPEDTSDLDFYQLPYLDTKPDEGMVVLHEEKATFKKGALSQLVGLKFYGKDITDGQINAYPMIIDEKGIYSDFKLVIECNKVTHKYELDRDNEVVSLEQDLATSMTFEEVYADLISHDSTIYIEASEAGKSEKATSVPQQVNFLRSSAAALDGYDFYGYVTDGENIFVSFDLYDPNNSVPGMTIKLIPLDGSADAQEAVVHVREVGDGVEADKHALPIENLNFDLTSTHVRIEIYFEMYSYGEYIDVLTETIDSALFKLGPSIKNVEFFTYIPVQANNIGGRFFVYDPKYLEDGTSYLSNLEIELIHPYGGSVKAEVLEPRMIDQMLAYPFTFNLDGTDFDIDSGYGLKYAIYADNSFEGKVTKGELMKKESISQIAVSNCTGVYVSAMPDYTNQGAEAFAKVYVNGYNDASFFTSFKFVSSEAGVEPFENGADFYNAINIPLANITASPEAGKKVTMTLIGNNQYELATFEITIQ